METLINNLPVIVAGLAAAVVAAVFIYRFFNLRTDQQLDKVREWLLWAVTNAEKDLGGGTGKLKLRQVYDLFVTHFPWLAKLVSFELFSTLVDEALEEMNDMLKNNQAVKSFVAGADNDAQN